jgi:hypothetical protein
MLLPADLMGPNYMPAMLITLLKGEDIAKQCSLLDNFILAELQQMSKTSHGKDSFDNLLFNVAALG